MPKNFETWYKDTPDEKPNLPHLFDENLPHMDSPLISAYQGIEATAKNLMFLWNQARVREEKQIPEKDPFTGSFETIDSELALLRQQKDNFRTTLERLAITTSVSIAGKTAEDFFAAVEGYKKCVADIFKIELKLRYAPILGNDYLNTQELQNLLDEMGMVTDMLHQAIDTIQKREEKFPLN